MVKRPNECNCKYCGKFFLTFDNDKIFCVDLCKTRLRVIEEREPCKGNMKLKAPKGKSICKHCGKIFITRTKSQKYCDAICIEARDLYKKRNLELNCLVCGQSIQGSSNTKYCGPKCSNEVQKLDDIQRTEKNRIENAHKEKPPGTRKYLSYEELNRRAEHKRLGEDWKRLVNWR